MTRDALRSRIGRTHWPVAVEQIEPLLVLLDPATHGGKPVNYAETSLSHIVFVQDRTFILRRALAMGRNRLIRPEDRWEWCEAQADQYRGGRPPQMVQVLPIVRRKGWSGLGGPGEILDWVLARSRPMQAVARPARVPVVGPFSDRGAMRALGGLSRHAPVALHLQQPEAR